MSKRRRPQAKQDLLEAVFAVAAHETEVRQGATAEREKANHLRMLLMPKQALLERDPRKRKSVRSPRQVGKSTGTMLITGIRCLEYGNAEWVVIGLTRASVKRAYWNELKKLNETHELGIEFQNQDLVATFPNGSTITFMGGETLADVEKLRGGRYNGVVIDEAKSYGHKLFQEMVEDIIWPALAAKNGELYIIGTPGDILAGPFYQATAEEPVLIEREDKTRIYSNWPVEKAGSCPGDYLWSLHAWTLEDNVTVFRDEVTKEQWTLWQRALETKRDMGWGDDHPTWLREYKGHWVPNDGKRVYRYLPHKHDYVPDSQSKWGLPKSLDAQGWRTVIGFDFGTRDGTALVVWAYHPHERGLWELYSKKRTVKKGKRGAVEQTERLSVGMIAEWYKEVEEVYGPFDGWPADMAGLATMVIDTLADEHQVYLEPAEKKEKNDHIELFNNDLDRGLIHIRKDSELSEELLDNKWDLKALDKGKRVESDETPNDLADAGLYAFRWSNHRRATDKPASKAPLGSTTWWEEAMDVEFQKARDKAKQKAAEEGQLDAPWWEDDSSGIR